MLPGALSLVASLLPASLEPSNQVTCDAQHYCRTHQTCCKAALGTWACCPYFMVSDGQGAGCPYFMVSDGRGAGCPPQGSTEPCLSRLQHPPSPYRRLPAQTLDLSPSQLLAPTCLPAVASAPSDQGWRSFYGPGPWQGNRGRLGTL